MKFARVALFLLGLFILNILFSACSPEKTKKNVRVTGGYSKSGSAIFKTNEPTDSDGCSLSVDSETLAATCVQDNKSETQKNQNSDESFTSSEERPNMISVGGSEFKFSRVYAKVTNNTLSLFFIKVKNEEAYSKNSCDDVPDQSEWIQLDSKLQLDDQNQIKVVESHLYKKIRNTSKNETVNEWIFNNEDQVIFNNLDQILSISDSKLSFKLGNNGFNFGLRFSLEASGSAPEVNLGYQGSAVLCLH